MAKFQIENYKKKIIISGLFFSAIWLLLSNKTDLKVNYELFPNIPRFEFHFSLDVLIVIGIIFPFLFLIGMNLLIFFHYSNQVSKKVVRRLLKMVMLLMIIFLFYITIGVATQPVEEPLITNSTSSTIITTTFNITSTPIIQNSTFSPSTTTVSQSTTVNSSSISPPLGLDEIVSFLTQNMIYIVIVIGIIFVLINSMRPSVPSERKRLKKLLDSDPNIRTFEDKPREHIISSYLYASRILEELGANDDYSLTPIEFQNDVKDKFRNEEDYWSQFPELTYWYELARFSNDNIPQKAVEEVNEAVSRLNKLVKKFLGNKSISEEEKND